MPRKCWTARYKGHLITLNNHWSFFPGRGKGAWVEVDGRPLLSSKATGGGAARLVDHVTLSGEQAELKGLLGWDRLALRGQIRIDGTLIGGDETMGKLEHGKLKSLVDQGLLRFVIVQGLLAYGLPFGVGMAFAAYWRRAAEPETLLLTFIIATVTYGAFMGVVFYTTYRQ
ncbi:MAG: hypothetical protein VX228_11200, partial [Pseudomonadota bacterium]|nr:hypothetical protein [Pseudomonadota bacterium]